MRRRVTSILSIVMERTRAALTIQKYLRGYIDRETVSIIVNKKRMLKSFAEQEAMFAGFRAHLLESLQIKLAYLYRLRRATRMK